MSFKYSRSTGGFYREDIHGENIPSDAVAVTDAQHAGLMEAQAEGKTIKADSDGAPVGVLIVAPLDERRANATSAAKAEYDRRLISSGFPCNGRWIQSDNTVRTQLLGLVVLGAALPSGISWTTMDGSPLPITASVAAEMLIACATQDAATQAALATHLAAIAVSDAPESIDLSTGWPARYTA